VHTDPVLKEAVEQTRGIFLSHDGKPIVAMFDSCCGGVTPFDIHGVNFLHAPYLARKTPCTFCKDCKMYNWSASYPLEQFEQLVKKEYKNLNKIKQVSVAKTDKAGLVQQVNIKSQHKAISLPGKKVYSMLAKVRSFCFDVCVKADKKGTSDA
jgi:SpoIID/LytB domain protein